MHVLNGINIYEKLFLTTNFYFSVGSELAYYLTLLFPLIYVWVIYKVRITENLFKKSVIFLSMITALPIFVGDIFVFGKSTYSGYTTASIFSWFTGIYDVYLPKTLASKFFFAEGNTIGILLIMLLPLLYYYLLKSKNREKILLSLLIIIHSLSMIIIGTRVGTFGAILVPSCVLVVFIFLSILKKEKFKMTFVLSLIVMIIMSAGIYTFSPAYRNQLIDAENDAFVREDNYIIDDHSDGLSEGENLIPGSQEFNHFYINYFEDNAFLISSTPKQYYLEYYYYQHDPKFWVDYIFNYTLEERINGRQFENIFIKYKWEILNTYERMFGTSYSTLMNGSIVLERDFAQQYYSFGYIGGTLLVLPWLLLFANFAMKVIFGFKKYWNMKYIMIMFSFSLAIVCGYISGHTIDQFITSMFISLLVGYLFVSMSGENNND